MPVLLFCIAFGLSMDYEVFLLSRIRQCWLASGAPRPAKATAKEGHVANDESVAHGVARTGRVITAAALMMSMPFAALIAAHASFMRMFGLGMTLAVAADATPALMVLVPAFMHVMGRWNWWARKPLVWLHERFAISEGPKERVTLVEPIEVSVQHNGREVGASMTNVGFSLSMPVMNVLTKSLAHDLCP